MNAVVTTVQPITVELEATRELRRKLFVQRDRSGHYWVGMYPPGKWKVGVTRCLACISVYGQEKHIDITEFEDGEIALIARGTQFIVTRAEADRLVAAFGFEVRKL